MPSLSIGEVEERLDRADAAPGGVGRQRVLGAAVVAGGAVREHEDHVGPEHQAGLGAVGDQAGPPLGIADRGEPLGRRQRVELAEGRRAVPRRAVEQPEQDADATSGRLRPHHRPSAFSSLVKSMTREYRSGRRLDCTSP